MDRPDEGKTPAGEPSHSSETPASALEPWPEPVCGEELLESLRTTYARFIVLPLQAYALLALWTLHTYVFDCFDFTPYLHITSPEAACGKSRLAELMSHLCANATTPGGMTASAMFHRTDRDRPTLLVDEWDSLSQEARQAAVNILNTGFKWNGCYTKSEPRRTGYQDRQFRTFCPKAIFGLGEAKLPDTTRSRCFVFTLHMKKADEYVERLTRQFDGSEFRRKCMRWANDNMAALRELKLEMPLSLSSRQEDISEPLLKIAALCGGKWSETARHCVTHFFKTDSTDGRISVGVLKEIRTLFDELKTDRLTSQQICERLKDQTDRPWSEGNDGASMTPKTLSALLAPYGIRSHNIKVAPGQVPKGFYRQDFDEIFSRYIPEEGGSIRYPATKAENIEDFEGRHPLPPGLEPLPQNTEPLPPESGSGSGS